MYRKLHIRPNISLILYCIVSKNLRFFSLQAFSSVVVNSSAEVYIPGLNKSCLLPNMTNSIFGHSQNNLLACGGYDTNVSDTTCEVFNPGVGWRSEPYSLIDSCGRSGHTSWTFNNGSVLLLGGGCLESTNTTELITPGVGTKPGFSLKYPIK